VLKSLGLQNFRGFVDHLVEFTPFTLLIGQNNAGKTTIIEALRIIATAQSKASNAKFMMAPEEYSSHFTGAVFRFSLKRSISMKRISTITTALKNQRYSLPDSLTIAPSIYFLAQIALIDSVNTKRPEVKK